MARLLVVIVPGVLLAVALLLALTSERTSNWLAGEVRRRRINRDEP